MSGAVLFWQTFALTVVVETPVYVVLLSRFAQVRRRDALLASLVVNAVSFPLFTLVVAPLAGSVVSPVLAVLAGEAVVCAVEAGMLIAWLRRDGLLLLAVALIANGCSIAVGMVVFSLAFR